MAQRKAVTQLQYMPYGQGVGSAWKLWGDYADTKTDTKALNEDRSYLKANNMVRTVRVGSPEAM